MHGHDFSEVRSILVCQLRQIGDVVLATPSLELLKSRFPHAALDVLTEARSAPVLENNPHVRAVRAIDKQAKALEQFRFYRNIRRARYDMVVDFQQLPRCRYAVLASGAPVRLSYSPPWYNRALYTHHAPPKPGYSASTKASALAPLGIEWGGQPPRVYLTDAELAWADGFLAGLGVTAADVLVTVDPTHRRMTRCWPHYGPMLRLALERRPELKFLLLHGPGERDDALAVRAAAGDDPRVLLPEEMLDLRQLMAVLAKARLHVGNCSAPRHLAVGVSTPTLVVRGATGGGWRFPHSAHQDVALGLDCQPCNRNSCDMGARCLVELGPGVVAERLLEHLAATSGQPRTQAQGEPA